MEETLSGKSTAQESNQTEGKKYARFDLSQRVQHFVLLVSFSLLGITGLAQKYATSRAGEAVLGFFGGIEMSRLIHRGAAVVLMAVSIYHLIQHLYQDILFYIGRRKHKAYYGRYSYAEKVEYLAVVWGTVIMAITGFMMWNPIATARWFPGEIIPASKAAHGGEALLAVLAIILWHFYHVHIRHFNRSIFTGALTEEEMRHEHPAELAQIKSGEAGRLPPQDVIQRRQRYFYPVAAILTAAMTFGLYRFITFEQTAITYVPPGETAPVFVPFTPTPTATALPSPTPAPGGIAANTWQGAFQELFADECGACHVQQSLGGLSLATYQDALEGGASGSAIVPGDPDASVLVQVQATGNHPGQLTIDELQEVIQWIEAGAPEQ
jgi:cytochrome b subunit of formate dehydrogenase/mono/diheme cytochrome c family protein